MNSAPLHPILLETLVRARHERLRREAGQERLLRRARAAGTTVPRPDPTLAARAAMASGVQLLRRRLAGLFQRPVPRRTALDL